ncbi:MAG: hypothetical protein A3G75_00010 [Verrucomicrobia bacterium RIFCSPLOWO2_12_FULL_64_8]|nr:MAG: hypothetical protein A3G75_00010 [Verrucomicrobia bacterium RIFCSPLOWO2_12_FULL_64_8]
MKLSRIIGVASLFLPALAWAVYAPIPEQEQGKALTITVEGNVYSDSNVFGAPTSEIDSMVYSVAPKLSFNSSVTDQTFFSASYRLELDSFSDRPGDQTLDSHDLSVRLAHGFSKVTNIDLTESYAVEKNPESLLAGITLNTDQSFKRNQFDGRLTTAAGEKTGLVFKYRNLDINYDNANLAQSLDRMEQLFGLELNHKFLPETTGVGEYRYQAIDYRHAGGTKDKQSNFFLGGLDYAPDPKRSFSGRAGLEDRKREGEANTQAPYLEFSGKYSYTDKSFVTGGYVYTLEESSDTTRFTDSKVNRFFVNVQHEVTPMLVASGSLTVQPSILQARRGGVDVDETTTRFGFALTYFGRKNFTVTASYDYDNVNSDAPNREQKRTRFGVSGRFYF